MARVGEGDPRWIVSERTDGANVNSWHWEERDLSKHTHESLKKAFAGLVIAKEGNGVESVSIEEVSEISGDVTVAQRKGKMMCYFELRMTLKWCGKASGSEDDIKGKMVIAEVDHDEFLNEYDISVSCQDNSKAAQALEAVIRSQGRKVVRAEIAKFFKAIFEEYHIGQTLKNGSSMPPPPPPVSAAAAPASATPAKAETHSSSNSSGEQSSFCWKMRWRAPMENLFNCLTDEKAASIYTRGPARIDAKAGGQFQFLGGVISGYYVDVQAPTMIKQQWRLGSWPVGVHSSVVMQLVKEEPGVTLLEFAQSGIPSGQLQSVQEGWKANFFEAMKMVYGFSMEYV